MTVKDLHQELNDIKAELLIQNFEKTAEPAQATIQNLQCQVKKHKSDIRALTIITNNPQKKFSEYETRSSSDEDNELITTTVPHQLQTSFFN